MSRTAYRVTPRLTLNYGMRWDYFGVVGRKEVEQFYTVGFLERRQQRSDQPVVWQRSDNNFAPRVAAAYDVTGKGKTVVRAGWGLFFDAFSQDMLLGHLPSNCVLLSRSGLQRSGPESLANGSRTGNVITPGRSSLCSGLRSRMRFFHCRSATSKLPIWRIST